MENQEFKKKKFDFETPEKTIIRGAIFIEKPSFNYTEKLKGKNKLEEVRKLKTLKEKVCTTLRINKQDVSVDEKRYKLWTSSRIIRRHLQEIKDLNLIPAIIEIEPTIEEVELEVEFP
ncbi:MAG TPA: hypothetical protein VJI68_02085 [Candidatus Nanoarchaeia archaeon]|nr:hypothetical protein [Candidatus Nanoarchaeia archaeon]